MVYLLFTDLLVTLKRILSNPTYMFNSLASVFYCLGYMPFWIFTAKYIEIQYRQSASFASLVTGDSFYYITTCNYCKVFI